MKIIQLLRAIRNTLELISVSGKDNMDRLLGCIKMLDTILAGLEEKEKEGDGDVCDQ